jgi:dihydrofolate reductase
MGKDGDLPWPRLGADLRFFRDTTSRTQAPGRRNAVIMGRRTWESVPQGRRPLPDRLNIVVTRGEGALPPGIARARSLDGALGIAAARPDVEAAFVIGGAELLRAAFAHPACQVIFLTRIDATFPCDVFLPPLPAHFRLTATLARHREHGVAYEIQRWAPSDPG